MTVSSARVALGRLFSFFFSFLLFGPLVLPLAASSGPAPEPQAGEPPAAEARPRAPRENRALDYRAPVVRGGPRPDLVILYTGEVMGWTEPCG